MPSSTAPISCSRETCFSALSWRRAPTKSRLIDRLLSRRYRTTTGPKKNVGVTHVTERPFSYRKYIPGCVDDSNGSRESALHVVLEDVDELGDEAIAAERPVEPAIDEHRRDRLLERAGQA